MKNNNYIFLSFLFLVLASSISASTFTNCLDFSEKIKKDYEKFLLKEYEKDLSQATKDNYKGSTPLESWQKYLKKKELVGKTVNNYKNFKNLPSWQKFLLWQEYLKKENKNNSN